MWVSHKQPGIWQTLRRYLIVLSVVVPSVLLLTACGDDSSESSGSNGDGDTTESSINQVSEFDQLTESQTWTQSELKETIRSVDVIFVIDSSGSTCAEQQKLAAAFDSFFDGFHNLGSKHDFQIAVTNMDTSFSGLNGAFTDTAKDILPVLAQRPWVTSADLNENPDAVIAAMKKQVDFGCDDSGKETGHRALKRALDGTNEATNGGFLREEALLSVIFVTDEEDDTFTSVISGGGGETLDKDGLNDYLDWLDGLKGAGNYFLNAVYHTSDVNLDPPGSPCFNSTDQIGFIYELAVASTQGLGGSLCNGPDGAGGVVGPQFGVFLDTLADEQLQFDPTTFFVFDAQYDPDPSTLTVFANGAPVSAPGNWEFEDKDGDSPAKLIVFKDGLLAVPDTLIEATFLNKGFGEE